MNKYNTLVGMDVHARSTTCAALIVETGERRTKRFGECPAPADIAAWFATLPQPLYCAYESGCTAFEMCRGLRGLGYDCDVIAVSTLPRSKKDRQQKCDRLDARAILREVANPLSGYTTVAVPAADVEAARDLARLHGDAVAALKRAKQQLSAFLLRHGHVWDERTPSGNRKKAWGRDFTAWLRSIRLEQPAAQAALEAYRDQVERCGEYEGRTRALVEAEAEAPRWKPYVDALRRLKGVDTCTAFLAACEFGDFGRFSSGGAVSAWLGTVPSNDSSGEKVAHGPITKAGNSHLRRALVEGNAGISRRGAGAKRPAEGQSVSPEVERMARRANARLLERFRHLTEDLGKPANKARIAVVNEQVRWIWAIGRAVQAELEGAAV